MEETKKGNSILVTEWWNKYATMIASYGGLVFCIIIFSILTPMKGDSIWSSAKLATLMSDVIVTALMAVGAVFIYALGNLDISIGKQIGLYAMVLVVLGNSTNSLIPGIVVCIILSVIIAVVNGASGPLLNIIPIIPSVVIMQVLSGIITIVFSTLGTRSITLKTIDYSIFKSPVLMLAVLTIEVIVAVFLFNYTRVGKYAKMLGANKTAAMQSGVSMIKYRIFCYMIAGISFVIAAIFQMGYTGSASDSTGTGFEMNIMVALILGGMPISGGMRSRISAVVVGSFTFSILDVGLPLIGLPTRMTFIVKAIIFLIVVLITSRKKNGALPK
jgi:ribose transport system permease protein